MNKEFSIVYSINNGADISINLKKPTAINIVGNLSNKGDSWQSVSISSSGVFDQGLFDSALYNNLDLISNNRLYERLKNYENKFKDTSEDFYKKWMEGKTVSTPDIYDWMNIYKSLMLNHAK